MRKGWKFENLKTVGKILSGSTPKSNNPSYWDGDIMWVTPKDLGMLSGEVYLSETSRKITQEGLKSCSTQLMPKGSIIMSSRAPIGHLAIATDYVCTNQGCKSIVPIEGMVSKFIYYFLLKSKEELNRLGTGAVFPEISGKVFGEFPIPVPSQSEQQAIVEKLDTAFELIDRAKANIEQNIQNAKELFQSKLNLVFSQKGEGWEERKLKELFVIRPPKKEAKDLLNDEDDVTFLPMEDLNVQAKFIIPKKTRKLKEVAGSYTYFAEDDVLLAKITPCFENGKLGIAKNLANNVGFGSSEYIVFRPQSEVISEYLYYFLARDVFRDEGKRKMQGAVGHKRVSKEFVEENILSFPPINIQHNIVKQLDELSVQTDQLQQKYQQKLANLEELKKSILEKAFKGDLI